MSLANSTSRLSTAKSKTPVTQKLPPKPKSAVVKYEGTKSVVDTGSSVNKIKEKEAAKNFVVGKNEIFKRIRTKRLAEYIEAEGGWEIQPEPAALASSGKQEDLKPPPTASELLNPRETDAPKPEARKHELSYLLLDLRDIADFEKCHIQGAKHYPVSMLSRATNEFLPEMYAYKNKDNRLIIVYDLDESIAAKAATTLVQKGIDNLHLLSGGIFDMSEKFPEHLVGTLPPKPGTAAKASTSGKLGTSTSRPSSTTSTFSTASSVSRASTLSSKSTTSTVRK